METKDKDKGNAPRNSLSTFRITKGKEFERSNNELFQRVKHLEQVCIQLH